MKIKNSLKLLIILEIIVLAAVLAYSAFFGRLTDVISGRASVESSSESDTEEVDVEDAVTGILNETGDTTDTEDNQETDTDQNAAAAQNADAGQDAAADTQP